MPVVQSLLESHGKIEACPVKVGSIVGKALVVQVEPRTVREWHPLEEMISMLYTFQKETDRSLSPKEAMFCPLMQQFRADASEGLRGAGAAIESFQEIANTCQPPQRVFKQNTTFSIDWFEGPIAPKMPVLGGLFALRGCFEL